MSKDSTRIIGGAKLAFDDAKHAYTYDGNTVPGVTTILRVIDKPALVPWAVGLAANYWFDAIRDGRTDLEAIHKESKNAHRSFTRDAANIGSNVHDYAECYFKGRPLPEIKTKQAQNGVDAFHKWVDANKIEILAVERRIYSKTYNYAGTTDFVARINGELGIGDYKTSSGIYPEMRFQTAAYQHALQEEKDMKFEVRWIVRFDKKTGEFEAKPFYDFDLDFAGFKGALDLHNALQGMKKKKAPKKEKKAKKEKK